jgi:glycosyltransferase 2 family protein
VASFQPILTSGVEKSGGRAPAGRQLFRTAAILATLAVSTVFGYFAVRGVNFSGVWRALRTSNYWWLAPSLVALACSIFVRAIRWGALFEPDRRPPLGSLVKATIMGYFFNSILPARAGEAARIVALKHYADTSRAETTGTVVVERIFDVSSLIVLLFALVAWLPPVSWLKPAALVAFASLAAGAGLGLFVRQVSRRPPRWGIALLCRLPGLREETVYRLTTDTAHGLATLTRLRQAVAVLAWTYLSWLLLGLSFWFLMIGFRLHLSPLAGLLVVIATGLAFIIPAAPAAVGVFEAAGLAVTSAYGVPRSEAFAYVLVLHALNLFPFLVAAPVAFARDAHARRPSSRLLRQDYDPRPR